MPDPLSIRDRPPGRPILHQICDRLIFLHWPVPAALLRPLVPRQLAIDTLDGTAWISIVPFRILGMGPAWLPPLPLVSRSLQINVRTYVHLEGVPGVWFLSLDASNPLAVLGARAGFALPSFPARMAMQERGGSVCFASRRILAGPPAMFSAEWRTGPELPEARPGSPEFFLTERYCLYTVRGGRLLRCRIFHLPWSLRRARLDALSSSMLESHGLPAPGQEPILHHQAAPMHLHIWRPQKTNRDETTGLSVR